ncbi:hypothetical protein [Streptomyces chartreusis]|uniref:hypothetical protein n=1 Tax=Streptomyces chartreusis TaxID=1969 RepID=UPI002E18A34A
MRRVQRLAAAGVLGAVLVTGAATTATASAPAGVAVSKPKPAPKPTVPAEPVLTAKASVKEIKAWTLFSVTGSSKDLTAGSTVTLQQKQGKKWVTLPAKTKVNKSHKYALKVKLGLKGKNSLRMVGGGLVSPVFYIKVK